MGRLSGSNFLFHDFPNKGEIIQCISEMPLILLKTESCSWQAMLVSSSPLTYKSQTILHGLGRNHHVRLAIILHYAVGDIMREELVKLMSLPGKA